MTITIPTDFTDATSLTAGRVTLTVGTYATIGQRRRATAEAAAFYYDCDNRRDWHYYITVDGNVVHEGDDLTGYGDADEMLETFAGFLSAWANSVAYMERNGREGENIHLFPLWLYETVGPEVEDLYALASDRLDATP